MFGFGKKKKEKELEERALAGDAYAQYEYADLLMSQKNGDIKRAEEFYLKAARQGVEEAVGFCHGYYLSSVLIELYDEEVYNNVLPEMEIVLELFQFEDDYLAKHRPFVERFYSVLKQHHRAAAQDKNAESLYEIAKFLLEDSDARMVYEDCGVDFAYDTAADMLRAAADRGHWQASELLAKIG